MSRIYFLENSIFLLKDMLLYKKYKWVGYTFSKNERIYPVNL